MNTMLESNQPEIANTNTANVAPRKAARRRENVLTWLVVVVSLVVVIQVFRTVALQLEVNHSLDRLYDEAGQALPRKS